MYHQSGHQDAEDEYAEFFNYTRGNSLLLYAFIVFDKSAIINQLLSKVLDENISYDTTVLTLSDVSSPTVTTNSSVIKLHSKSPKSNLESIKSVLHTHTHAHSMQPIVNSDVEFSEQLEFTLNMSIIKDASLENSDLRASAVSTLAEILQDMKDSRHAAKKARLQSNK